MVKEKPNSTRIYDEEGFRRRAACICVKNEDEKEVRFMSALEYFQFWLILVFYRFRPFVRERVLEKQIMSIGIKPTDPAKSIYNFLLEGMFVCDDHA